MSSRACLFASIVLVAASASAQDAPITLRAGAALDGRGGTLTDVTLSVADGRITRIDRGGSNPTYDLRGLTVMPGWIDTHVHIFNHFGKDGRANPAGETPTESMLYAMENAYVTLMAGFTTVQSLGTPGDRELREAVARGRLAGPRILTSLGALTNEAWTPDAFREGVRRLKREGADLIKIFASKSSRDGGGRTLNDAQIEAACGEARALGMRTWVHAHAADAMAAVINAGCQTITHGTGATDDLLREMAAKGMFFEPQLIVTHNYLDHKAQFLGVGNYTEEGFANMARLMPAKHKMFERAAATPGLKIVYGTDAVAGTHGRNYEEFVYRVQDGKHRPMDVIVAATSRAAEALGLQDHVGALAPGFDADIIATDGDPLTDITAVRRVVFVMRGGKVYKDTRAIGAVGSRR